MGGVGGIAGGLIFRYVGVERRFWWCKLTYF
jgi:hypothetical protein